MITKKEQNFIMDCYKRSILPTINFLIMLLISLILSIFSFTIPIFSFIFFMISTILLVLGAFSSLAMLIHGT